MYELIIITVLIAVGAVSCIALIVARRGEQLGLVVLERRIEDGELAHQSTIRLEVPHSKLRDDGDRLIGRTLQEAWDHLEHEREALDQMMRRRVPPPNTPHTAGSDRNGPAPTDREPKATPAPPWHGPGVV